MEKISGQTLLAWGYTPGPWFKGALEEANRAISLGSIMAGDWEQDAPWRKKREQKAVSPDSATENVGDDW